MRSSCVHGSGSHSFTQRARGARRRCVSISVNHSPYLVRMREPHIRRCCTEFDLRLGFLFFLLFLFLFRRRLRRLTTCCFLCRRLNSDLRRRFWLFVRRLCNLPCGGYCRLRNRSCYCLTSLHIHTYSTPHSHKCTQHTPRRRPSVRPSLSPLVMTANPNFSISFFALALPLHTPTVSTKTSRPTDAQSLYSTYTTSFLHVTWCL